MQMGKAVSSDKSEQLADEAAVRAFPGLDKKIGLRPMLFGGTFGGEVMVRKLFQEHRHLVKTGFAQVQQCRQVFVMGRLIKDDLFLFWTGSPGGAKPKGEDAKQDRPIGYTHDQEVGDHKDNGECNQPAIPAAGK